MTSYHVTKSFLDNALFLVLVVCFAQSCSSNISEDNIETGHSLMMMRFGYNHSSSEKNWNYVFENITKEPGCCDEIWFSTGFGYPELNNHRKHAEILKKAKKQLDEINIKTSVQLQVTIGHGDYYDVTDSMCLAKNWGGWTGPSGIVDKHCSCPRQKKFLNYIKELSKIYAEIEPETIWIDDDLRYFNHLPATDDSTPGCWCDTCIAEFNKINSSNWTRETLATKIKEDSKLLNKWTEFNIKSLVDVAKVIANEVHSVSPKTRLGLQHSCDKRLTKCISTILYELYKVSHNPVESRPGGSYYHEINPCHAILKSMMTAHFIKTLNNPYYICNWCPEITTRPRVYGSRSAQSIMIEGFTALAYGFTSLSYYITEGEREKQELYVRELYKPISDGSEVIKNYAKANLGTIPVGYEADVNIDRLYNFSITAIPVLPGIGKSLGKLTNNELKANIYEQNSSTIQQFRDNLPAPAVCSSPFVGLMIPRIDSTGALRTIGLINTRIDRQQYIRIRLDGIKNQSTKVFWCEIKKRPIRLPIEKENKSYYVTIPDIDAWSAGYLSVNP